MSRCPLLPRLFAAVAFATLLAGCSMTRMLYNQADWLLLEEMDSYLDLRDEQRERVAGALTASLQNHRVQQLPGLATALREAAVRARRGLTDEDAGWVLDTGDALMAATARELLPVLSSTLAELDAGQRKHLAARLDERNREYTESHWLDAPREERLAKRAEVTVDRVKDWIGPLSDQQVALVTRIRNAMPDSAGTWLAYNRERQQGLLRLLESGAGAQAVERYLYGWWVGREGLPQEAATLRREGTLAGLKSLLLELDASLDSVQREYLVDRLEDLAEDATVLARET